MTVDYKTEFYEKIKPDYKEFEDNLPAYWVMKYRDRFLQMIEQLPSEKRSKPTILEVGCGTGRALSHFKEYGAVVLGVEPGDWAIENTRLLPSEIIQGDFMQTEIEGKFDIVYFEQVLSHIPDYTKVLLKAKDLLSEGGILALEEPNEYNPLQMVIAKEKGIYWNTEDHCNYFTIMNMEFLLKEMGFKTVYKSCTFPMELFHLMGFDYIGNNECGKRVHFLRYKLLSGMEYKQRKELKEKFAEMGWGRDLFLIVRGLNNA